MFNLTGEFLVEILLNKFAYFIFMSIKWFMCLSVMYFFGNLTTPFKVNKCTY